jgi:hypothetical protein
MTTRLTVAALIAAFSLSGLAAAHSGLTREQLLEAATIRNATATELAKENLRYFDGACGRLSDAQVSDYLHSDYHHTLVALYAILPDAKFRQLQSESLARNTCRDFNEPLRYLHDNLGIQP